MSIAWKYLDKRSGAVQAIKDYSSMRFIIDSTDGEIKQAYDGLTAIGSSAGDGMPHSHDPQAGESRVVNAIAEIDVLKERYRQAMEYMDWFSPAWNELTEEERFVLTAFYITADESQTNAVCTIEEKYSIERSSAYNKKNKALNHLVILLYGKG